eukprot:g4001.t1
MPGPAPQDCPWFERATRYPPLKGDLSQQSVSSSSSSAAGRDAGQSAAATTTTAAAVAAARPEASPPPPFRCVTYNVLADPYCTSKHAATRLFPHCAAEYRAEDYRGAVATAELAAYAADLVALQEVTPRALKLHYEPGLEAAGLSCVGFTLKVGGAPDGVALFARRGRFKAVPSSVRKIDLRRAVLGRPGAKAAGEEQSDGGDDSSSSSSGSSSGSGRLQFRQAMDDCLRRYPHLEEVFQQVTSVALLAVLEDTATAAAADSSGAPSLILAATTHLFYHPHADHVRILQAAALACEIESAVATLRRERPGCRVSVVLSGDTNGMPETGVTEFLKTGRVSRVGPRHWNKLDSFRWNSEEEEEEEAPAAATSTASSGRSGEEEEERGGKRGDAKDEEEAPKADNADTSSDDDEDEELASLAATASGSGSGGASGGNEDTAGAGAGAGAAAMVEGYELTHSLGLRSCAPDGEEPPFTNYVRGFTETLDYIFVDAEVDVLQYVPLPPEEAIADREGGWLPSRVFPSDHLPVIADLKWRDRA